MIDLLPERAQDVERRARELGWIQSREHVEGMSPAGEGNMNRTLRVSLRTRSLVLKQSVPFVAKYPQIPAPADRIRVEAAFYRATTSPPAVAMRLPLVHGFDAPNRLLCLEDLGAAADFTDIYRVRAPLTERSDLKRGELTALLFWIGALHGLELDVEAWPELENREMRQLNHTHIFDLPVAPAPPVDLDAITPGLAPLHRELVADARLVEKIHALGEVYLGERPHDSPKALLHGDYYPGSWLHDARSGIKIIDPEFAFFGPAELDVGVLVAHLLFAGLQQRDVMGAIWSYNRSPRFSPSLALGFAGAELIRRLLGVAQLPLVADLDTKRAWLATARQMVLGT